MIIGIDLGTTNSAAAVWRGDGPALIPNRLGHALTPSAVSIDGDAILVGLAARERQPSHPQLTATAFKRYMGTTRTFALGERSFTPEELSALVLRSLREDAEAHLGEAVTEAVVTVPAYFNDRQRRATRRAGELAGLKVERLINEPTAAALAYGLNRRDAETCFLVFDLGGGTFDVSILEIFEGVIEVRSSTGDNRLGGEDFNELLVRFMAKRFAADWGEAGRSSDALLQKVRDQAERARRELSAADRAAMRVVWQDRTFEAEVTARELDALAEPLVRRLREPVLRALRDGAIPADRLAEIVLVGGATRMPLVRRAVTRMFGRFPNASVNPDEAVALGAAVQAGLKARDAALREVVVTDVCPFSLGVDHASRLPNGEYEEGLFSPIIERNTVVPVSRIRRFATLQDNQAQVRFGIYQGESRLVAENVRIGEIAVPTKPAPAGQAVDVRFSYDVNGLLEVDVHMPDQGESWQLVIADDDRTDLAELESRRAALATLKQHPREAEPNRAALARAERCWQDALGETRQLVEGSIGRFQAALASQDVRASDAARAELLARLDEIDGKTFL